MRMNAPTKGLFILCFILIVGALVSAFVYIPYVSVYKFWIMAVGSVLLLLSNMFKGL